MAYSLVKNKCTITPWFSFIPSTQTLKRVKDYLLDNWITKWILKHQSY